MVIAPFSLSIEALIYSSLMVSLLEELNQFVSLKINSVRYIRHSLLDIGSDKRIKAVDICLV